MGSIARSVGRWPLLAASLCAAIALLAGSASAAPSPKAGKLNSFSLTSESVGRYPKNHSRKLQSARAVSPLTVTVTDEPDPVRLTNEVRYFITVTNDGTENANFVTLDSNTDVPATCR